MLRWTWFCYKWCLRCLSWHNGIAWSAISIRCIAGITFGFIKWMSRQTEIRTGLETSWNEAVEAFSWDGPRGNSGPLRVGYISPDFYSHSAFASAFLRRFQRISHVEELHCDACQVSYFIHSALKYHDPAFVAVTCARLSCFLVNVFHEHIDILLLRSNWDLRFSRLQRRSGGGWQDQTVQRIGTSVAQHLWPWRWWGWLLMDFHENFQGWRCDWSLFVTEQVLTSVDSCPLAWHVWERLRHSLLWSLLVRASFGPKFSSLVSGRKDDFWCLELTLCLHLVKSGQRQIDCWVL